MIKPGLTRKITSILVAVSLLSVLATALFMLLMTRQQFANYINTYDQAALEQWQPLISDYYAQYGPAALQDLIAPNANNGTMGKGMGMRRGSGTLAMRATQGQRLIVTDAVGLCLADSAGMLLGQKVDFKYTPVSSAPLNVDGRQIGNIYVISPLASGFASLESEFVDKITVNAGILALVMALIALTMGLVLGQRVSAPLGALSAAIHQVARGKLEQRVSVEGDQEFAQVARDFNLMAQHLEDTERNRRRLTADLSHELRTPLAFLRGQLEGMQAGKIPMDAENATLLLDETIRLSRLVKELDNLALVENHAVVLEITTFSIEELLDRLTPVSLAMQDRGIKFHIQVDKGLSLITADMDRLLQILLNLLSNALRHVGRGGEVRLSIQGCSGGLQFAVADNGPGIPAGDLPYVFERFYRVDDSRNRREGGMGLGLAIARGYTEAHHGRMWVESSLGSGTTFYFTLPQS